jgi:hypothetical protein
MAANATFALKAGEWFRRGRLFMVSPVRGDHRRFQAEIPLIDLFKFAEPALSGGRGCAFDEQRVMRTAKSCGPDVPRLASSLRSYPRATVSTKSGRRGEHEISRKTIAQGRPDCFR